MIASLLFTRQLTTNTLLKLGAEVGGRAATFLLLLLAARRLTTADFGSYNYALALGFVLVQMADFGLQLLVTREVARLGLAARPQVVGAFRLKLWLCLPVVTVLVAVAFNQPVHGPVIFLLGLTLLLQTFVEFVAYVFRGQQRLWVEVQLLLWVRVGTAVFGALILWQTEQLLWLAIISLLVMASALLFALSQLRQAGWVDDFAQLLPSGWPVTAVSRQLIQQAWPLGLAIFLSIAYTRLAILLLAVWGDAAAVAHYSAAWRLVEPTQILPASLLAAVFPAFSLALTQNRRRAGQLGRQTSLLLALAGAAVALIFGLAGPWLVGWLYGPDFAASAPVLQVLGLTVLPVYLNYSLTHYLVARGQQQMLTALTAVTLLLHALFCWLLIPQFGVLGPALSVLAAESVLLLGCVWALRQPLLLETAV
ncbi:MAG: oligosaccharide flippase family protein [Anaerolineaceae bacterium]|nr:oligosaccharide flippase family protein [Anaerolineaceae bacterium]